jgi:hypothetical protein
MSCVLPSALFTLSVDLELDPLRHSRNQQKSLEEVTEDLVRLLGRYQIPATWAVADPAVSAATDVLLAVNAGHEIAVLGDPTWVGAESGRARFARELARRVSHGRAAGLQISTLALRGAELADHLDLVVKQEITAVRSSYVEPSNGWFTRAVIQQPAALRFGLWEIPTSIRLPGVSCWKLGGGGGRRARNGVNQAIAAQGVFHVQVDALSLADRGPLAQRKLEQILRHVALCREATTLELATLAQVAQRLSGPRTVVPARSILHPAA